MFDYIYLPKNEDNDIKKLVRYVSRYVANEMSNIDQACYKPKLVKIYKDVLHLTGFDKKSLRDLRKNLPTYTSQSFNEPFNFLIIVCIIYFLKNKEYKTAKIFYYLLGIKAYSSSVHKHYRDFCNDKFWRLALDKISSKHIYKVKNGIGNSVIYFCNVEYSKKYETFKDGKFKDELSELMFMFDILYNLRHRIAQSFRAFANVYYKLVNDTDIKIVGDDLNVSAEVAAEDTIPDKISLIMCVYSQMDKKALYNAIVKSGIDEKVGESIVEEISTHKYRDKIRFIIVLISRILELNKICKERSFNKVIKELNNKNFKIKGYIPKDVIKDFIYDLGMDYTIKTIDISQLITFFSYYMVFYIRYRIC